MSVKRESTVHIKGIFKEFMSRGTPLHNGHLWGRVLPKKNIFCWLKLNKKVEIERVQEYERVSGKLPTYPSPKATVSLSSYLGQNVGLGEG